MPTDQPLNAPIRLTHLSHGAGCACKLGSFELSRVVRHLVPFQDAAVLVDAAASDDAAVYRIDDSRAIVATADFFTPIVDDPFDFGRIAAANALSDIYAMGARPLFALNLVAFPRKLLGAGILEEIIRGGSVMTGAAGVAIVGGHSIDDAEPKYGLCVIGEIDPARIVRNGGARVGDALVLTKAIGTGIITTALKKDAASATTVQAAVDSMTVLNRTASEAMLRHDVHAATDITGFGLLGHLGEMLRASGVAARVWTGSIPLLPDVRRLAKGGFVPGGTLRNLDDARSVHWQDGIDEVTRLIMGDAQTSGGLLIALAPDRAAQLVAALRKELPVAVIGEVIEGNSGTLEVVS
jgi:selenide,water dikinase